MPVFYDANHKPFKLPRGAPVYWRISVYPLVKSKNDEILMVMPTWSNRWELQNSIIQ